MAAFLYYDFSVNAHTNIFRIEEYLCSIFRFEELWWTGVGLLCFPYRRANSFAIWTSAILGKWVRTRGDIVVSLRRIVKVDYLQTVVRFVSETLSNGLLNSHLTFLPNIQHDVKQMLSEFSRLFDPVEHGIPVREKRQINSVTKL